MPESSKSKSLIQDRTEGHLGFTGSRSALSKSRYRKLKKFLKKMKKKGFHTLHHGDAVGSDHKAHLAAADLGYRVVIHPPENPKYRAYSEKYGSEGGVEVLPKGEYMKRNRDIVNTSSIMIAMPIEKHQEELRSGTWACIRYARKVSKKIVFI